MDEDVWTSDADWWRHRPVAVTGATGFLGSHLVAALVDLGAQVHILVRDEVPMTRIVSSWNDAVTRVRGDLADVAVVERLLADGEVRTVFHLAAQSQVGVANRHPLETFEANVRGTWNLLEAVRRSPRVEQVVTASSDKAYGTQPVLPYEEEMPLLGVNPYDASKACGDIVTQSYQRTYGVPACVTRCGNFYGPGDLNWERLIPGTIRSLLGGVAPVIRSDGTMIRDYLFVQDGVRAYLRLAEAMAADDAVVGEAFNFSTEVPLSVLDVVDVIQKACGTAIRPEVLNQASHEIPEQHLSAAKARRLLGWAPSLSVQDSMDLTVAWYRDHLGIA